MRGKNELFNINMYDENRRTRGDIERRNNRNVNGKNATILSTSVI